MAEERVLILLPTKKDGERTRNALAAEGLACTECNDVAELCREIGRGAGAALLTEELASDGGLRQTLAAQPPWSDFPLVVLAREGTAGRAIAGALNVTLVERPIKIRSLLSVVESALRSRRRQYEVRDHLVEREKASHDLARLAAIVESSEDAIVSKSLDGIIRSWNSAAERLFGYSREEAVGRPITLLIPPERLDEERAIIERIGRGERVEHFDTVRVTKAGKRIDISLSISPVRDGDGKVVGASKVARDVTGRRKAEEELRRLAETLGLALDAGSLGTWDWDAATDDMILSARTADIYGVAPDRPHKREALRDLLHPDFRGLARATAARAMANRTDYDLEYPLVNGKWVSARGRGVYGADGIPVRMIGVVQDVTERRRQEESLRRSEGLLRLATDAAELGVWVWDVARDLVSWENERPYAIFGLDPASGPVTADRFRNDFVHPDDSGAFGLAVNEALRTGERFHFQGRLRRTDGEVRWVEFAGLPLKPADGSPLRMHGTAADITRRKRAEQELREADRKKDDFIALLAHELRNPLAPIRNGLQVLRLGGDEETVAHARDMMGRQLAHMVRLIDDLLDISRINRNKMELRRDRLLLADVLNAAVETARPAIDAEGHELSVTLPGEPIHLYADLTRLSQVFGNLLTNSAKYTPKGGRVKLTAKRRGNSIDISVKDNGIGIPEASLANIFDMFSQVDRSIERSTGGLGIGLALVKGLVEMHDGTVSVESAGQGKGSEFTVALPILESKPAVAFEGGPSESGRISPRRILVVDDNRDGADSLAMMLELMGNEVHTAYDGVEAVEHAEKVLPDVILMDVGMPRMNGLEATRKIRGEDWGKTVKVIALTGWGQENDRALSRSAGCDGHLVKPVELKELERMLAELE